MAKLPVLAMAAYHLTPASQWPSLGELPALATVAVRDAEARSAASGDSHPKGSSRDLPKQLSISCERGRGARWCAAAPGQAGAVRLSRGVRRR